MDDLLLLSLGETLDREMPITRSMEVETVSWEGQRLSMKMPLGPNRNHQDSAFAGSLSTLCTVVGWGTLFMLLEQKGLPGNIVIRRGTIRYLRPVHSPEIVAAGLMPTSLLFSLNCSRARASRSSTWPWKSLTRRGLMLRLRARMWCRKGRARGRARGRAGSLRLPARLAYQGAA